MMPPLRSTPNMRLAEHSLGRTLATKPHGRGWRHPWFTEALWLPKRKAWVAVVLAGFVNGVAPMVRVSAADLREARGAFFGPLIDAYSGTDEIAQAARLALGREEDVVSSDGAEDVPLYLNPPLGLRTWRRVGYGGSGRVPLFFQDRGVKEPPRTAADQVPPPPPAGNRLLCACDVFLEQPRAALSASLELNPAGAVTGTSLVSQTLRMREKATGAVPRLQSGEFSAFAAAQLNFRGAASLVADYEEQSTDRLKVATVWMLSPANAPLAAEPDATWQPFVQHDLFWNLHWSQPLLREAVFASDVFSPLLGSLSLLGGGAGFVWASSVTASINDAVQGAYNILQATSLAGSFWTPTGGGTTSAWPETTSELAKPGLDKSATAAAKARMAARARLGRRLDPSFPFEGQAFNLRLLTS